MLGLTLSPTSFDLFCQAFPLPMPSDTSMLSFALDSLPLQPSRYRLETRFCQRHEEIDHWRFEPVFVLSGNALSGRHPREGLLMIDTGLRVSPAVSGRSK